MKILLAVECSTCSKLAVEEVCSRTWPAESTIRIVSVAHTRVPDMIDITLVTSMFHYSILERKREEAAALVARVAEEIRRRAPSLQVESAVLEGDPDDEIVAEANRWEADLILLGSHGYGRAKRMLLGSVSEAVAVDAPCSVEVVRRHTPAITER